MRPPETTGMRVAASNGFSSVTGSDGAQVFEISRTKKFVTIRVPAKGHAKPAEIAKFLKKELS